MDDSLKELLEAANAAANPSAPRASAKEFYLDSAKKGLASGVGNVLDVIPRAVNLGKAAFMLSGPSQIAAAVTGRPMHEFLPEITKTGVLGTDVNTEFLRNLLGVKDLKGGNSSEKMIGALIGGAAGGAVTPTGTGGLLTDLAKSAFIGGAAGLGGEVGGQLSNDSTAGRLAGSLIAGVAAPALMSKYPQGVEKILNRDSVSQGLESAAPYVKKIVEGQTKRAVAGSPGAAENITDALTLQSKLPGFKASVGEMADSPGLLEMQRRYTMSSPQSLNKEVARSRGNLSAVDDYFNAVAPASNQPSVVRSAVNQSVANQESQLSNQAAVLAGKIPTADQLAVGSRMGQIAEAEKIAARPAITAAYEKAFNSDARPVVNLSPVIEKAEEILGTKLSQVRPDTAPNTITAIRNLLSRSEGKTPEEIAYLASRLGGSPTQSAAPNTLSLRDVDGLRKAINADIAQAGFTNSPVAATQLRNLSQLHKSIDDAITSSPLNDAAKQGYFAAVDKYRTEFAPRFKEGSNLRMFKDTSLNEPRILPDKFTSEYFKTDSQGGLTKAEQFKNLFGKNPEATSLAKDGIIDRYRNAVIDPNTGHVNLSAHNKFITDHKNTLAAFKKSGVNAVDDIFDVGGQVAKVMNAGERFKETAKGLKYDTVDQLVDASLKNPRVMGNALSRLTPDAREQMQRLLMEKARNSGTASGMADFLSENKKTLSMALSPSHVSALEDVAKAMKLIERNPIKGSLASEGPDIIKNMTGVSTATVWSQYRATTGGRQGLATGLFNLAAPVATKLGQREFSAVMEDALHSPETAKKLRDFLMAETQGQANIAGAALANAKEGAHLLWDAKGPIAKYMLGTRLYGANTARAGAALTQQAQENNQGQQ